MPEAPLEQERFKRRLIATARSLEKKQQQLQADQDLLNDRWADVLVAEEYGLECPTKSYPKRKLLPQFDNEAQSLYRPCVTLPTDLTDHHMAGTERQVKSNTRLHYLAINVERQQL